MHMPCFLVLFFASYTTAMQTELLQPGSGPACKGSMALPSPWLVEQFGVQIKPILSQSHEIVSTGFISFTLNNTALRFLTKCRANSTEWPHYFDGNLTHSCDTPPGQPDIDSATFTYSWTSGMLTLRQTWICTRDLHLDLIPRWTAYGELAVGSRCDGKGLGKRKEMNLPSEERSYINASCYMMGLRVPMVEIWVVDNGQPPHAPISTVPGANSTGQSKAGW